MNRKLFAIPFGDNLFNVAAYVRESGPDLLFFLHGLGCSKISFHHIWLRPEFDRYSLLALDLVGFGESDKPDDFSYSMEDQAIICAELLKRFPANRIHTVAHSMGGAIALLLPQEILNRTQHMISVEGNLVSEDCSLASRKIVDVTPAIFEAAILPKLKAVLNGLGYGYADIDAASPVALYRSAESLVHHSDSGLLLTAFQQLACHKAYIYGDDNAEHPTVAQVQDIPKIRVAQSGHFVMNDNPGAFYGALQAFLSGSKPAL